MSGGERGRIVLVGDGPWPAVSGARPETRVPDVYSALGEVAVATARRPVELVLVHETALPGTPARIAEALRRLDPALRVMLVRGPGANGHALAADDFDGQVVLPGDTERLRRLLRGDDDDAGAVAPPARDVAPTEPGDDRAAPEAPSPPPIPQAPEFEPAPEPAPEPETTDVALPPPTLGDVDLVHALLRADGRFRDLVQALLVEHTGWRDAQILAPEAPPTAQGEVPIEHGGVALGRLVASGADAEALRRWAAWLGPWLLLAQRYADYRLMAYRDDLTGAWNRRFFERFLRETLARARERRRPVSILVFDIDDFKRYNDDHGHGAGDEVLVETVRLLESVIRREDRVCRIGGDEFVVVFADLEAPREAGSTHPSTPEAIAERFQRQITGLAFPKLGAEAPGNLSVSAGLATYPWDGLTVEDLLRCADERALQSKRSGKNALTMGPDSVR